MPADPRSTILAAALVAMGACKGDTPDSAASDAVPALDLLTDSVDFGSWIVPAASPPERLVELRNTGDAVLHLKEPNIEDSEAPFSITDHGDLAVDPGANSWVSVRFDPGQDHDWDSALLLHSDDPSEPQASVGLTGSGLAPEITVSPESVELGTQWVGCEHTSSLEISNTGRKDLTILGADFDSASAWLSMQPIEDTNGSAEGVHVLEPGESLTLAFSYAPLEEGTDEGRLTVSSDDPRQTELTAPVHGAAEAHGSGLDRFTQRDSTSFDLIVALDKTPTMESEVLAFACGMLSLFDALEAQEADFRLAVVVDEDGCVRGTELFMDGSHADDDAARILDRQIAASSPGTLSGHQALTLLDHALAETTTDGCNEDLVRADAVLHLMGVSDDEEQSCDSWEAYLSAFQAYKEEPDDVLVHAIGGNSPKGCDGAEPYTNMLEAVEATGGIFLSICDLDWQPEFATMADELQARYLRFALSDSPVSDTLEVRVDGVTFQDWALDSEANAITFTNATAPEPGASIEVEYLVSDDCHL